MKKKLLATVLATVLCLSMSMTAFGAQSPTTGTTVPEESTESTGGSEDYTVITPGVVQTVTPEQTNALNDFYAEADWSTMTETDAKNYMITKSTNIAQQLGVSVNAEDVTQMSDLIDLEGDCSKPILFNAPGIVMGKVVIVLHLQDNGQWETVPAVAGDGWIMAMFNSLSPVLYMQTNEDDTALTGPAASNDDNYSPEYYEQLKADQAAREANAQQSATAPVATTSPKTGETAVPAMVAFISTMVLAGYVVSRRKVQA